jgi:transposase
VLDPSRSARVPIAELGEAEGGIVSVDRYVAYKTLARLHPLFILAFCWAHVRRDFLKLANSYPDLATLAFVWVDKIGELYHLNNLRLESQADAVRFASCDRVLRQAIDKMALDRAALLNEPSLADPARAVLQSMQNHWSGLTVFVDHPEIPMDNNPAERTARHAVVGRKNFYGSGSQWSGELTATMYSVLLTVKLWELNPRTWLNTYLHACAENGNQPPSDLSPFLPWTMSAEQTAKMKRVFDEPNSAKLQGFDSS